MNLTMHRGQNELMKFPDSKILIFTRSSESVFTWSSDVLSPSQVTRIHSHTLSIYKDSLIESLKIEYICLFIYFTDFKRILTCVFGSYQMASRVLKIVYHNFMAYFSF
jgi:hypothetical protein